MDSSSKNVDRIEVLDVLYFKSEQDYLKNKDL